MAYWEDYEEYLTTRMTAGRLEGEKLGIHQIASEMGISVRHATTLVQAYGTAQRKKRDPKPQYTQYRAAGTRTKNALWMYGNRARDARAIHAQFAGDTRRRADEAIKPLLDHIVEQNPRAILTAAGAWKTIDGALDILVGLAEGEA
jgi:hypothetical protein